MIWIPSERHFRTDSSRTTQTSPGAHVEIKPDNLTWNQAKRQGRITKVPTEGHQPRHGADFVPRENLRTFGIVSTLISHLSSGPLDIVGDVHGEIDPLLSLMHHLGYDEHGFHPDNRKLVFVGDLTDRGPDSLTVVNLVQTLTETQRAQCVLGNHELNILLNQRKHDNGWFYGEEFSDNGYIVPQALANNNNRDRILDFFNTLPIALEREDLRVIHACWHAPMMKSLRETEGVIALTEQHEDLIEKRTENSHLDEVDISLEHQNQNPVRRLTSGPEERIHSPFFASGKMRHEQRVQWWNNYNETFCVFGHYSIPDGKPRGNQSSFCVDYGVGKRWTERRQGRTKGFTLKLAALRWPEKLIVFDEGESRQL